MARKPFIVEGKVWKYTVEPASWYFVYVEQTLTEKIKKKVTKTVGFRFVPIEAKLGKTVWRTTLFPTKEGLYLLALKASVRRAEDIREGENVRVSITLK